MWDFENRLTQAVVPGQNGGTATTVTFKYDPFGRRIQKSGPTGTTNYLYNGPNLLDELDGSGNILAKYAFSRSVDRPLAVSRATITSYYEQDAIGTVSSLTDSTGAPASTYTYDSFGNLASTTGTVANSFRYTGREFDSETGVYYYRARYYNPMIGMFISEDPARFGSGNNFYAYVNGDPLNVIDPSGLKGAQCFWMNGNEFSEVPCSDFDGGMICHQTATAYACDVPITPIVGYQLEPLPDFTPSWKPCPCKKRDTWANPDFITLSGSFYWSLSISVDRNLNVYVQPIGGGNPGASVTINWMNQSCEPTPSDLQNMLSGTGVNLTEGFIGGVSQTFGGNFTSATGVGIMTPGLGFSVGQAWNVGKLP